MNKSKINLTKFQKDVGMNFLVLLGVVVVFISFFYLFSINIKHQVDVASVFKKEKEKFSNYSQNLALLVQDWKLVGQYKEQVEALIPIKDNLVDFPKIIDALAKEKNISIGFSFGKEQNNIGSNSLGSIEFTSTMSGNRSDVVNFIREVENKYYSMQINVLDFVRNQDGSVKLFMRGTMFFVSS